MGTILNDTKKLLGIEELYTQFDTDILIHINTVMLELQQLGVLEDTAFEVPTDGEDWEDLKGLDKNLNSVKTFIYLKVRLYFDPPQTSFAIDAIERQLHELAFRLNIQTDE